MKVAPQNYAVISLGSNIGDSAKILTEAIDRLSAFADGEVLMSSLWQTKPVGCPPGSPMFLNSAAAFVPRLGLTPESLLANLKRLEAEFGRKPKNIINEARPLDLDIITFQTELRNVADLVIPHPRAQERAFVLGPVSEILPLLRLPGQGETVSELFRRLPTAEKAGVRIN